MWNSHCSIRRGSDTCRNPLGSFSLRTSRQYSIMPVVWRSFMVQCVIWSRTIWNECEREVRQTRHGVGPTWAALGSVVVVAVVAVVLFYRNMPRHNQTAASPFSCPPSSPFQFFFLVPIDIRCYLLVHTWAGAKLDFGWMSQPVGAR